MLGGVCLSHCYCGIGRRLETVDVEGCAEVGVRGLVRRLGEAGLTGEFITDVIELGLTAEAGTCLVSFDLFGG